MFNLVTAILIRAWLSSYPSLTSWLEERPTLNTPNTSWNKVREGFALSSSYDNQGNFYGSTLLLWILKQVNCIDPRLHTALFIACDVLTAIVLKRFVKIFLKKEFSSERIINGYETYKIKTKKCNESTAEKVSHFVFMLYLFNPMTILTCISKATVIFNNLCLSFYLLLSLTGNLPTMTFFLALSSYETLYPVQLIFAACLSSWKFNYKNAGDKLKLCMLKGVSWFLFWLTLLFVAAAGVGRTSDVFRHYEYILFAQDQSPSLGVFWYFFTEVFEHFESMFLIVFQLNAVFYCLPLSIKLRRHPVMLGFMLMGVVSVFKSYPVVGDSTVWISLFPMWSYTFMYLRDQLVPIFVIFTCSLLSLITWFAWITLNAANANFFFASNLCYSLGQLYLLADVMSCYNKWTYHIDIGQTRNKLVAHSHVEGATLKFVH